jgi:hypothetical protein
LLKGLIFTSDGRAMTPHSTKGNGGRLYRYYMSTRDSKEGHGASGVKMLPAGEVEQGGDGAGSRNPGITGGSYAGLAVHQLQPWRELLGHSQATKRS